MYYRNRFSRRPPMRSANGQGSFRGVRRIKTFDPSLVVNAPREAAAPLTFSISHSFNDFNISQKLRENVFSRGYKTPTPIQDQSIIPLLEGRDLIGIANTGTGKTAAFLIPLIEKVIKNGNEKVIIIAPTRELAEQIKTEFIALSGGLNIYAALCIGGANLYRQISELRRMPNFVIGTPGRIDDLIRTRNLNLAYFGSIVLDEADMMVDIGFIKSIRNIISLLPPVRQALFFSATVDGKVAEIIHSLVRNPVMVSVKTGDTVENIEQKIIKIADPAKKIDQLHQLLISEGYEKVLIFGRTKFGVQKLTNTLTERGFRADSIHGNKNQSQRQKSLDKFKNNVTNILIATDVASRGLDIPNVSHVINYDLPESYEAYIHRIGRTGRADKKGVALTFVN